MIDGIYCARDSSEGNEGYRGVVVLLDTHTWFADSTARAGYGSVSVDGDTINLSWDMRRVQPDGDDLGVGSAEGVGTISGDKIDLTLTVKLPGETESQTRVIQLTRVDDVDP